MKPSNAKVAVIGLVLLVLLSSSSAVALTLPNPPDRGAPANNQTGPLPNAQSFAGGVFLVKDGSADQNVSANEFIAEYLCFEHNTTYVYKQFETGIGESVSGPLSAAEASGVIDATNSVRPPKTVGLPVTVGEEDLGGNLTYVLTGMVYNVTTYSVWTTTQQAPAVEQRAGYIVVSVPAQALATRSALDMAGSSCDSYALAKWGAGWGSSVDNLNPLGWLDNPLGAFSTLPEGGLGPILSYGPVKVLSSSGVAGAAYLRPGENATFLLPPGSYSAVADVTLFGIPFSVGSGTYSSPGGAAAAQFTVSLTGVYNIFYGLEVVALVIVLAVVFLLNKWLHLWRALVHASKYLSRTFRSGWRRFSD
ncbi:MAG: hypothetical protein OK442_06505 [Thaumarchaeota archaeon]|nr:hypothetical protein [Nitrososphaerota archaeon]